MSFPRISKEPIEVKVGKHESVAVIRPMNSREYMKMAEIDLANITKTDPLDIASLIVNNVISLEGVDDEITVELLSEELYITDLVELLSEIVKVSKVSDKEAKNLSSLSESQSPGAETDTKTVE